MKWGGGNTDRLLTVSGVIYLTIAFSLVSSAVGETEISHECSSLFCAQEAEMQCHQGVISILNATLTGALCDYPLSLNDSCSMQAQCKITIDTCLFGCTCFIVHYDCVVLTTDQTTDKTTDRTTDQTTDRTTDQTTYGATDKTTVPATPPATSSTPHSSTTVTTRSTSTTTLSANREGLAAGQAGATTNDESSRTVGIAVGVSVAMVTLIAVTTFCLLRRRRLRSRDDKLGGVTYATNDPNTTTVVAEPTADVATGNTDTSYVEYTEISDSGISTDVATDTEYTTINEVPDDEYLEPIRTGSHPPTAPGHRGSATYFVLEPEVGNPGTDQSKSSIGNQLPSQQDLSKHQKVVGENLIYENVAGVQEDSHGYLELEDVRK